ncbi:Saccharopine dehydrogenase NADP binding domain [seawater metagenome]|uniref:Saccharopine dehydrogenase NADP binding domain n=1 Tax=seawater metagenome TaxID=1561972 RepID=A0A5E8CL20_9ZZZZ
MINQLKKKYVDFDKKIVIIGFGCVAQGLLPLILKHINIPTENIVIITADNLGVKLANEYNISYNIDPLDESNYSNLLKKYCCPGDMITNLSVCVDSIKIIQYAQDNDLLYIDASLEFWDGVFDDETLSKSHRTNYYQRERMLEIKKKNNGKQKKTAVVTHGANPGLVEHFVKQALLNLARDENIIKDESDLPTNLKQWAELSNKLNIKIIQIAERDTQQGNINKKKDEFVNTWSVDGFVEEMLQPSELGFGSHETYEKIEKHDFGCKSGVMLNNSGSNVQVKSWTPLQGEQYGNIITHHESIEIADLLTLKEENKVIYRPTVYYAYHPCDDAVLSMREVNEKNYKIQSNKRIMMDEIIDEGVDQLGVLLLGHKNNGYWFGSTLSMGETRKLVPYNNATSLQVTISMLAGMIWAIKNPNQGLCEPLNLDHQEILEICKPYLGEVKGYYTNWYPKENLWDKLSNKQNKWGIENFILNP